MTHQVTESVLVNELADPDTTMRDRASGAVRAHRQTLLRKRLTVAALSVLTIAMIAADIAIGSRGLELGETIRTLFAPGSSPSVDVKIVWELRMPMTATAVLVGAALSLAGAQMQTVLNNPLAEPYTLGVSAAASFGAALSLVLGFSALPFGELLGTAGTAWVFAIGSSAVIIAVNAARGAQTETIVLLGIAMVFLFSSLLALMQYIASEAQLQQVVFWTLGSLGRARWPQVGLLAAVIMIAIPALMRLSPQLTAMRLGDERARALGVPVVRLRIFVLAGLSVVAATAVSIAGSIAFIGMVGPHVARMLVGESHRYFLATSVLTGSIVLCGSSLVAKLIIPGVILPVGIITSIIGVPVFLSLILSRRRTLWA
ncbi:iron ABC transporter permease [Arthrobacter alkaliphilus]|uniref:FecCD family ABC transporter permease n=1 Tax=Arthrobacter alkaliphilus TaxID=369936 RepID=UPI001F37D10F|nr:iron ABC transporter permease [Arthrobacter alkaliphilus]